MRELELSTAHTDRMLEDYREDNGARFFDTSIRSKMAEVARISDSVYDAHLKEIAKLYREDGRRKYSDAEHQQRMNALTERRDNAFKELKERAVGPSLEVSERLELAVSSERYLSEPEMEKANGRKDFVREGIDRLPLEDVPSLLREAEISLEVRERFMAHLNLVELLVPKRSLQPSQTKLFFRRKR